MIAAVKATQKKYCSRAILAAIIFSLPFIAGGYAPMGKGLILGALFSIVNFVLIGETLPLKTGRHSRRKLLVISMGSMGVRFALLALPVIMSVKLAQFHLGTTVIGIFMVQLAIVSEHSLKQILSARKKRA